MARCLLCQGGDLRIDVALRRTQAVLRHFPSAMGLSSPPESQAAAQRFDVFRRAGIALALAAAALLAVGCASLPRDVQRAPSTAIPASVDTELGRIAAASAASDPALSGFRLVSWSAQAFATRIAL